MEHTINVFGVWTDVAPDKFVLMLQRFKTGGLVGVHWVSLWFGWWMQEGSCGCDTLLLLTLPVSGD